MATGKRKSSSGRKTSGRKTNSGRKKNDIQQESFTEEVILWVILAISILLLSVILESAGQLEMLSAVSFGVFGLIAYIFPVVLVIGTFFAASNKGNRIATVKIAAAVFFVLFYVCLSRSCAVARKLPERQVPISIVRYIKLAEDF